MRVANEQLLAAKLLGGGPLTVGTLSTETGLSVPTVHRALGHLNELGLIRTYEATTTQKRGRPAASFGLSLAGARVAVADVGNESARFGLVDEVGSLSSQRRIATEQLSADLVGSLSAQLREPLSPISRSRFLVGAVVGLPAAVDPALGKVVSAPIYRNWVGLEVRAGLRAALGCPVEVFQDDHLAAWGERGDWGDVGAGTVAAISIGKGIGIGWADERGPFQGDHGRAGRVADWPEPGAAGHGAVLADVLTGDALVAAYGRRGGSVATTDGSVLSGLDLAELARNGDQLAGGVFDAAASTLGYLLVRVGALLDPSLMVVRGGLAGARDLLDAGVAHTVGIPAGTDGPLRWTWTRLGDRSVLTGATRMAGSLFQRWLNDMISSALLVAENANGAGSD
jgi:predicted NBD/HSP70 family sugar kinase